MSIVNPIIEITDNSLDRIHESNAVVVFSADWCESCHTMLDHLKSNEKVKFPIYNCDVDQNEDLADQLNITNLPVIGIVHDGELVDMMKGLQKVSTIVDTINSFA